MSSAAINRLMDNLKVRLPGALDSTIQAELFTAMDAFLRTSGVWTQEFEIAASPTAASPFEDPDAYTYRIHPPTGAVAARVLWAAAVGGGRVDVLMPRPDHIQLTASPNVDTTYRVNVTLSCTDPVTRQGYPVVPDWIYDTYQDVLLDGTLAQMMSQAAKPYSSLELGAYHARKFSSGVASARIEAMRHNVFGAQGWRYPQHFAVRHRR